MLQEKSQEEILEYFKEKIDGDMAKFHLSRIYYMAKEEGDNIEKRSKLEEIAKIKSYEVQREIIIDETNAVFETKDKKNGKMYTAVVVNGKRSAYGYFTLEQGLLGWLCEKQGFVDATWHICRMLNINNPVE